MLEEIAKRGRKEWEQFDSYRSQAFQPTQEEIEAQEKQERENMVFRTQWYLALYGIEFIGNEKDFTQLYTLYIKWNWSENNGDMKEWLGGDNELKRVLEEQIEWYNNLKDFCKFIIWYER